MHPTLKRSLAPLALLVLLLALLALPAPVACGDRPLVFVSIPPQRYFVTAIAGDLVDVSIMVMPGASPATYEPTPEQMRRLTEARAYFAVGVPFESAWLKRFASANPAMPVIHTEAGIAKMPMAVHHDHDGPSREPDPPPDHDHHGILDPHVWLSPELARGLAQHTCQGLMAMDPAHAATFEANLAALLKDMDALDADISKVVETIPEAKRTFMVFHPAWGYFARQYELRQVPIQSEGKEPGPRQLAHIVRQGRDMGIGVVFVQPQFSDRSARVIATEMGARVIPLDPLAEDWDANLRAAAEAFRRALR